MTHMCMFDIHVIEANSIIDLYYFVQWKLLKLLTFTMIKPKQQITRVFDMNCARAMYEYKSSICSVKTIMFWCLRINEPIVTMDIAAFSFWLFGKIANNLSRKMSIWPPACNT